MTDKCIVCLENEQQGRNKRLVGWQFCEECCAKWETAEYQLGWALNRAREAERKACQKICKDLRTRIRVRSDYYTIACRDIEETIGRRK